MRRTSWNDWQGTVLQLPSQHTLLGSVATPARDAKRAIVATVVWMYLCTVGLVQYECSSAGGGGGGEASVVYIHPVCGELVTTVRYVGSTCTIVVLWLPVRYV